MVPNHDERFLRIELELRRWRVCACGAALFALVAIGVAAAPNDPVADKVSAREFVLTGPDGKTVGRFFTSEVGVHLSLKESNGFSSAMLTANSQRAGLYLENQERLNTASIEAYLKGGALGLTGESAQGAGKRVMEAKAEATGSKIEFRDPNAVRVVSTE